ncbi:angiopoietin-related protein 4-like isoform X2 [Drosophila bipectinata]|uniref:angiopoietin-related protein 4-like isoform X2 n=1 Tax=Drosophila bipectinata TaxID=42026 RepID=UPI0038B2DE42
MKLPTVFLLTISCALGLEQESCYLCKEKEDQKVIIEKENNDSNVNSVTKVEATNTTTSPSNSEKPIRDRCPATQGTFSFYPEIQIPGFEPFEVGCYSDLMIGSGWMEVYFKSSGSTEFNSTYEEYINGFGDPKGLWFIGLEKLHILTNWKPHKVYIYDFYGRYSIRCANFVVGDKGEGYMLKKLEGCTGDISHFNLTQGTKFSAYDRDEDGNLDKNWAKELGFGWWFSSGNYDLYYEYLYYLNLYIRRKD